MATPIAAKRCLYKVARRHIIFGQQYSAIESGKGSRARYKHIHAVKATGQFSGYIKEAYVYLLSGSICYDLVPENTFNKEYVWAARPEE